MREPGTNLLAGIFLISSATLSFQITLTRYFSISQNYHFAFLVISIAFLGYGASGSFLSLFERIHRVNIHLFLTASAFLCALSILASFLLCNIIPFDFIQLLWNKKHLLHILFFYILLSLPFFFAGLTISGAVSRLPSAIARIYFFDLFGAGTGSVIAVFIFLPKGERGVFIIISFLALSASFLFSFRISRSLRLILAVALLAEIALFGASPRWMSFRISPFKALPQALKYPHAELLLTRWNSSSRVDVLQSPAVRFAPGLSLLYEKNLPPQLGISADGGDLSAVTHFKSEEDPSLEFLRFLPSSIAYSLVNHPKTLIFEPKGGGDVLAALVFKSSRVKVIESNPLLMDVLQKDLSSFSGHLYGRTQVQAAVSHPRAALKKEKETFDLIVFSLTDVFGSSGTGLYGFGEDYLYTVESFSQVIDLLSPGGIISMTLYLLPPPRQEIKMLATWAEALEKKGKNAGQHIAILQTWGTVSYFIKEKPFSAEDLLRIERFAAENAYNLVYCPGGEGQKTAQPKTTGDSLSNELFLKILSSVSRENLYKEYLFHIKPATDDRPFFFSFYKLSRAPETYKALGGNWLALLQGGGLIPAIFLQALIVTACLIFGPLFVLRRRKAREKPVVLWKVFLYFGSLGAAFIFVEIVLIQKFVLFLEHPLYSLSVVLVSLLLSSGVGSFFSHKILGQQLKKRGKAILLLCACLLLFYMKILPPLFSLFIGAKFLLKIFLSFLIIFPLGFFMGIPFPTGIRLLSRAGKKIIPWAWSANAFSTVVNSVGAAMVAFWAGTHSVFVAAAGGYLVAFLLLDFADHRHKTNS